jgi:hypothetical protein
MQPIFRNLISSPHANVRTFKPLAGLGILMLMALAAPVFAQKPGYLKTVVEPGRAGVFVDGKYVGPAKNFGSARKYPLTAGEHEVKLAEPRYEEVTQKVTITAGKTTVLNQSLKALPVPKPPFGMIRIVGAAKYSAVYINDKYYGHADEYSNSSQRLLIPPGEYDVKVVGVDGGASKEEKVKITADQTTIITVK